MGLFLQLISDFVIDKIDYLDLVGEFRCQFNGRLLRFYLLLDDLNSLCEPLDSVL